MRWLKRAAMVAPEAVVLCGGRGTRLGTLTADTPKPLLPVGGVPFLLRHLAALKRDGVPRVILSVQHLSERFDAFVRAYGDGLPELAVVREPEPLGTGGALKFAARFARSSILIALNGDSWVDQPLAPVLRAHRRAGRPFTMVVVRAARIEGGVLDKGVIMIGPEGEIVGCHRGAAGGEAWVNAGLYVLDAGAVRGWPDGAYAFEERVSSAQPSERGFAFRSDARLLDIGTPECYALAQQVFSADRMSTSRRDASLSESL